MRSSGRAKKVTPITEQPKPTEQVYTTRFRTKNTYRLVRKLKFSTHNWTPNNHQGRSVCKVQLLQRSGYCCSEGNQILSETYPMMKIKLLIQTSTAASSAPKKNGKGPTKEEDDVRFFEIHKLILFYFQRHLEKGILELMHSCELY